MNKIYINLESETPEVIDEKPESEEQQEVNPNDVENTEESPEETDAPTDTQDEYQDTNDSETPEVDESSSDDILGASDEESDIEEEEDPISINDSGKNLDHEIDVGLDVLKSIVSKMSANDSDKHEGETDINTLMNIKNVLEVAIDKNSQESFSTKRMIVAAMENISYRSKDIDVKVDLGADYPITLEALYDRIVDIFKKINTHMYDSILSYHKFNAKAKAVVILMSNRNEALEEMVSGLGGLKKTISDIDPSHATSIIKTLGIGNVNINDLYGVYTDILNNIGDVQDASLNALESLYDGHSTNFKAIYKEVMDSIEFGNKPNDPIGDSSSIVISPLINNGLSVIKTWSAGTAYDFDIETKNTDVKNQTTLETLTLKQLDSYVSMLNTNLSVLINVIHDTEKSEVLFEKIKEFIKPTAYRSIKDIDFLNNVKNVLLFLDSLNKYLNINIILDNLQMISKMQIYASISARNYGEI